jgi:tetratricopeptide (TPR) repeat protein
MGNLGMIAALRDDDAEAERWYRKAMAADPTFPLAYRRLADLHYERHDYAAALELYRKALAERPDDFAAAVQAGNSARRTGQLAAAASYFKRAAHDHPASWVPVYNLACLEAVKGDPPGALALLASMKGFQRPALLENDRDLATVRSLPGYDALLQRFKAELRTERRTARQARLREPAPPADADPD